MEIICKEKLKPFDVLLYARSKFGIKYFHCAWYVGRTWGMMVNYESMSRGPEIEEWKQGNVPTYVLRIKELTKRKKLKIVQECTALKDKKYDWRYFFGHYLKLNNPDEIRCDELIELPLKRAGINTKRKEDRPRAFLQSKVFKVFEYHNCNNKHEEVHNGQD